MMNGGDDTHLLKDELTDGGMSHGFGEGAEEGGD
jgi:hypothetical protein